MKIYHTFKKIKKNYALLNIQMHTLMHAISYHINIGGPNINHVAIFLNNGYIYKLQDSYKSWYKIDIRINYTFNDIFVALI
jgi:hypothetical protein